MLFRRLDKQLQSACSVLLMVDA
ncbi:hypothetical protein LINGRAHAP2_LOCUS2530 [Linum grandiflorum]